MITHRKGGRAPSPLQYLRAACGLEVATLADAEAADRDREERTRLLARQQERPGAPLDFAAVTRELARQKNSAA